jgi:hypothetical protein
MAVVSVYKRRSGVEEEIVSGIDGPTHLASVPELVLGELAAHDQLAV